MKISVSMLSTYLYCPRMLFLQKVLELEEVPKEVLVMGSIRHESFDMANKREEPIITGIGSLDFSYILQLYKQNYSKFLREIIIKNKPNLREVNVSLIEAFKKSWPSLMTEADSRALNVFSFIEKNNVFGKELWEKLIPKIKSEFRVESEQMQLKGVIDKLYLYEDSYVPVEFKTGKMPRDGLWPGHRIQIGAYAMLLEEKFNTQIKEGFVHYLDADEKRHLEINPFLKEEIKSLVYEVQTLIEGRKLPDYCQNKNKCKKCSFSTICYNEEEMEKHLKMAEIIA